MARVSVGPDAISKPTKYRADHGTMTIYPDSSVPTMQITIAGSPPVFLQNGEFYDQNGEPYDFDRITGGEDWLRDHITKTANKKILAMHGFLVDGHDPKDVAKVDNEYPDEYAEKKAKLLSNLSPSDTTGDADLVLSTIGDGEMDFNAIMAASGLPSGRVQRAMAELGTALEKTGEGKRGSPYLYRRDMQV